MTSVVFLDTGVLAMVTHPRKHAGVKSWLERLVRAGVRVVVPEVAGYELRRKLLHLNKNKSVWRLDRLGQELGYCQIATVAMRKAAEFWAEARRAGRPTAAPGALDADAILAAQAATAFKPPAQPVIATDNVGHLARFVTARRWSEIG